MGTVYGSARSGSFEEFVSLYADSGEDPTRLLLRAVFNPSPVARVKISHKLLDDGADASVVDPWNKGNCLHLMFSFRTSEHDFALEATLLKRLLDGGADINRWAPALQYPLCVMMDIPASEEEFAPWYEIIFSRPELNLDAVINEETGYTVRDRLLKNKKRTERIRHVHEHDAKFSGS